MILDSGLLSNVEFPSRVMLESEPFVIGNLPSKALAMYGLNEAHVARSHVSAIRPITYMVRYSTEPRQRQA